MGEQKVAKQKVELTKEKVEVYGLFGDYLGKWIISAVLLLLFIAVLTIIAINLSNGSCGQVWWLSIVNVTLGFGLRFMFKHYFR